jgi:hypothetical protein
LQNSHYAFGKDPQSWATSSQISFKHIVKNHIFLNLLNYLLLNIKNGKDLKKKILVSFSSLKQ